jgi:hypothetical protein
MDIPGSFQLEPAFNAAMLTRSGINKGKARENCDRKLALAWMLDPLSRRA